jgi:hypothetical protein
MGTEPLPRWDKGTKDRHRAGLQDAFAQAESWRDLDRKLAEQGLKVMRKGQGLVIGDDSGTMKLSDLGRDVRLKGLEERFGESFAAHDTARQQTRDTEKSAAFEQLADAGATAEMSYYLYRMGLATQDEVQRNFEAQDRAQNDVKRNATISEILASRPVQPTGDKPETPSTGNQPQRPRDRSRGRGR